MKFSLKILAIAVIAASTYPLTSCSAPAGFSYSNIGIAVTAYCSDCPAITYNPTFPQPPAAGSVLYMGQGGGQGGTLQLTAAVTNAPSTNITWSIYPSPNLTIPNPPPTGGTVSPGAGGSSVGTFNTPNGTSNTTASGPVAFYTNGGIPVYSGAALQQAEALGIPQGDVLIVVSAPSDPNNPSATTSVGQLIQVYNTGSTTPTLYLSPVTPTSPAGLTDSVAVVPRNNTFQFYGGAVGEQPCLTTAACNIQGTQFALYTADNSVVWKVGDTSSTTSSTCNNPADPTQPASACPDGWISSSGLYTAPPTVPPTGTGLLAGQVVVVMASHFLPTITKIAYITIN